MLCTPTTPPTHCAFSPYPRRNLLNLGCFGFVKEIKATNSPDVLLRTCGYISATHLISPLRVLAQCHNCAKQFRFTSAMNSAKLEEIDLTWYAVLAGCVLSTDIRIHLMY